MRRLTRWGIMAVVGLLVLGTMGAALADEPVEEAVEPGSVPWALDVFEFVLYWGFDDPAEVDGCGESDTPAVPPGGFFGSLEPVEEAGAHCLDVAGPNGQVNHGSFVSSFVHWLKDVDPETLPAEWDGLPKGQLVKQAAGHDFGKGNYEVEDVAVGGEALDGGGPPEWVEAKKAAKAEAKAEKKNNK